MIDIEELMSVFLNDEASSDEVKQLFKWIRAEPENAKKFARFALIHAQLRGQFGGDKRARESGEILINASTSQNRELDSREHSSATRVVVRKSRRRISNVLTGSIVGCLIVVLCIVLIRQRGTNPVEMQLESPKPIHPVRGHQQDEYKNLPEEIDSAVIRFSKEIPNKPLVAPRPKSFKSKERRTQSKKKMK